MRGQKMSEEEIQTAQAKGTDLVGYCCNCGVEFDQKQLTNHEIKCSFCDAIILCRIKPNNEE
jgi:DNA-directed RNA polymerase subunit RPC12/RpoP